MGPAGLAAVELERRFAAIDELNPALNAFLSLDKQGALKAAELADATADPRGPLAGVPVSVKDAFATANPPATFGSRVAAPVPESGTDALLVRRLRQTGAAIVGKTNMSELCIGEYILAPAPRSLLTPDLSPGASSGGCAVAVAAGFVDASIATDTGGSIRGPAAFCGVVGFKPSYGTLPLDGAVPLAPSLDHAGVIAKSVDLAARVFYALGGRKRVGRPDQILIVPPAEVATPEIAAALERVSQATPPDGARIGRAPPRVFAGWQPAFEVLMPAEAASVHRNLLSDPALGEAARSIYQLGDDFDPVRIAAANLRRADLRAHVEDALPRGTVIVSPTVDGPARASLPDRGTPEFWDEMCWMAPLNLTGGAAISVPILGTVPPLAMQVAGGSGADAEVLAVACWIEKVLDS
jgi:aspartyl-tRNA(Asn)/glutamyl-tRNA(Gln) amidotransferase subunit A